MSIPRTISNNDDIIDSRDVIARIDWLYDSFQPGDPEEGEYLSLTALAEQGENGAEDWLYGATLIRYSYFTQYVKYDYPEIHHEAFSKLPEGLVIDWQATAEGQRTEYTELTFDGVTYLVRG